MADFPLPTAACALVLERGFVLATTRRLKSFGDKRLWGFPGGKEEPNEDLFQTAIRETEEETGYVIAIDDPRPFFVALSGVILGEHVVATFLGHIVRYDLTLKTEDDIEADLVPWQRLLQASTGSFPYYNSLVKEAYEARLKGNR